MSCPCQHSWNALQTASNAAKQDAQNGAEPTMALCDNQDAIIETVHEYFSKLSSNFKSSLT